MTTLAEWLTHEENNVSHIDMAHLREGISKMTDYSVLCELEQIGKIIVEEVSLRKDKLNS